MGQTRGRRREKSARSESILSANGLEENTGEEFADDFVKLSEIDEGTIEPQASSVAAAFYGLLSKEEESYFQNAESILATNALAEHERESFIGSVFEEARGKELKLATNKILSKLLERLIVIADDQQLAHMLKAFSGHTYRLSLQRYSSHCVEALFQKAAELVNKELIGQATLVQSGTDEAITAESLVIYLVNDLVPHVKHMAKEKYSSHVLRASLVLLSGLPWAGDTSLRSRKSKLARKFTDLSGGSFLLERQVPDSFKITSREIIDALLGPMSASELRNMAIDPLGSPLLQIILRIEINRDSLELVAKLLDGDEAQPFWQHMLRETIGSHFLESVLSILPRKTVNNYFREHLLEKLTTIAKHDGGSHILRKLLITSNLGPKQELIQKLTPEVGALLTEDRASLVASMLDVAEPSLQRELSNQVLHHFGDDMGSFVSVASSDRQKSRLLQACIRNQNILDKAGSYLAEKSPDELKSMALDPIQSHNLEALLHPNMEIVLRRRLLNVFVSFAYDLSVHSSGSHVLDALWTFCYKLKFLRERIAAELAKREVDVKHSLYGKSVWKNWSLEKYLRKRHEWWAIVKAQEDSLGLETSKSGTLKSLAMPRAQGNSHVQKTGRLRSKPYDRPVRKVGDVQ